MTAPPFPGTRRPDWRFALGDPFHLLALGLGSGLSPWAPGTAGTLVGWASYLLLVRVLPVHAWGFLLVVAFLSGIWICGRTARALGVDDPSPVVWDEIVAIWLVLWLLQPAPGVPAAWWMQLLGFALFRLFDAVKRGPVGWADRHVKGGLGIMFDDLVAAGLTLAVMFGGILAFAALAHRGAP